MTTSRQVLEAFEAVQALYWDHPVVQARNAAMSAALEASPPFTYEHVRNSRLEASYRSLEPIVHHAKELVARALPWHPLSQVTLWQCYPTCELQHRVDENEALSELAQMAERLLLPVDPDLLKLS